jgi:methionyl-tRNA synthetase
VTCPRPGKASPMAGKFYLTTAIDYVNSFPHLGTAYEKICADVIVKYMRLRGWDTYFSMGNDEHSQNVYRAAVGAGKDPQGYCDEMAAVFKKTWAAFGINYDDFIRTTEDRHTAAVEEIFRRVEAKGDVYMSKYSGHYCVSCEAFYQKEDLVEGNCPTHKMPANWIEEENYFFALSKYTEPLLAHIKANEKFIMPEARKNEIVSFIESGLQDVSISRSGLEWGIPVPGDPDHVFYVWFDALINYISVLGFPDESGLYTRYWPADVHLIGKDITRFHCIMWPAMLMSAGIDLPKTIIGHGFIGFRGERMSKTLGNIVEPLDAAKHYGPDSLRYYLAREVVFGKDGDFSWDQFIQRYNSELANDLGNLLSRTCGMLKQYFDGGIPAGSSWDSEVAGRVKSEANEAVTAYFRAMDAYEIHNGISEVFKIIRAANRYIEERAPWALMKKPGGKNEAGTVLFEVSEVLRQVALLLYPFIPAKAQDIWNALGIDAVMADTTFEGGLVWRESWDGLSKAVRIGEALFPRIEEKKAATGKAAKDGVKHGKKQDEKAKKEDKSMPEAQDNLIDFEEFKRLDIRVAHIKSASMVPETSKLMKIFIDIGGEERQIVAGIAEHYAPEDLTGKNIIVIANLKPAKIRGVESRGMLLAATDGDKVILLVPDKDAAPGSKIS